MDEDVLFSALVLRLGLAPPEKIAATALDQSPGASMAQRLHDAGCIDTRTRWVIERAVAGGAPESGDDEELFTRAAALVHELRAEPTIASAPGGSPSVERAARAPTLRAPEKPDGTSRTHLSVTPEIEGRYRTDLPLWELGRGGLGSVVRVFDSHCGRHVALKELLPDPSDPCDSPDSPRATRFLREARITSQLEHPNIVPVYEIGQRANGVYFYTMKVVRGRTLADELVRRKSIEERLELLPHFGDLCRAIAFAHAQGVVHRDLKPSNVMVGEFGETVVLDWGLAKFSAQRVDRDDPLADAARRIRYGDMTATADGSVLGTPAYMSPEQAKGEIASIDERSDVWSLGVVLFEILNGHPPFTASSPMELLVKVVAAPMPPAVPGAPADLSAVANKALQRDRKDRYQDATTMSHDVDAFLGGRRVAAYDYPTWDLLKRFARKNRALTLAVTTALVLIVTASVVIAVAYGREQVAREDAERQHTIASAARESAQREERRATALALQARGEVAAAEGRTGDATALYRTAHHLEREVGGTLAPVELRLARLANLGETAHVLGRVDGACYGLVFSPDGKRLLALGSGGGARSWNVEDGTHSDPLAASVSSRASIAARFATRRPWAVICRAPDRLLVWDAAKNEVVLDADAGKLGGSVAALPGHAARTVERGECAAFISAGGDLAGTLVQGRRLVIVDTATGAIRHAINHDHDVVYAAQSDDRTRFVTLTARGEARLWQFGSGEPMATVSTGLSGNREVWLDGSGSRMLVADRERAALWDLDMRRRLHTIETPVWSALFFDESERFVTTGPDGVSTIWNAKTGAALHELKGHRGSVRSVVVTTRGRTVLTAAQDRTIRVYAADTGAFLRAYRGLQPVPNMAALDPAGRRFAVGTTQGEVSLWNSERARALWMQRTADRVYDLDWSPGGRYLATSGRDGYLHVWDGESGAAVRRVGPEGTTVSGVRFTSDGRVVLSTYGGRVIQLDASTFERRGETELGGQVYRPHLGPDGLMSAGDMVTGKASIWRSDGEQLLEVDGGRDGLYAAWLTGTAQRLVTYGMKQRIAVFDVASGKESWSHQAPGGLASAAEYAPGADLLATGTYAGEVLLWDVAKQESRRLRGDGKPIFMVQFSGDASLLFAATAEGRGWIWRTNSGELLHTLEQQGAMAWDAAFSPDGSLIAVVGGDRTVHVFDTSAGTRVESFPVDVSEQGRLLFSGDGKRLAVTSDQGEITVWRIDRELQREPVMSRTGRETNLRLCRETLEVVPVIPFPEPESIWAPEPCGAAY